MAQQRIYLNRCEPSVPRWPQVLLAADLSALEKTTLALTDWPVEEKKARKKWAVSRGIRPCLLTSGVIETPCDLIRAHVPGCVLVCYEISRLTRPYCKNQKLFSLHVLIYEAGFMLSLTGKWRLFTPNILHINGGTAWVSGVQEVEDKSHKGGGNLCHERKQAGGQRQSEVCGGRQGWRDGNVWIEDKAERC